MNEVGSTIAAAVEEQNATTAEIGRNMTEAAQGSTRIAGHVAEVARDAQHSAGQLEQSRFTTEELRGLAQELNTQIAAFQV